MRKVSCLVVLSLLMSTLAATAQNGGQMLAPGSLLPDFSLTGTDGAVHKAVDVKAGSLLVVAFLCNRCTQSQVYEERLNQIAQRYAAQGVVVMGISSSNPKAVGDKDLAWTDVGDSLADMKERAAFRRFSFPYLYDGDAGRTAQAFGARMAPTVFVFDKGRRLRYEGKIDSDPSDGPGTVHYVADAIGKLLADKPVAVAATKAEGCELRLGAEATAPSSGDAGSVDLALAKADVLSALRHNPTGKLLLINFYATWCGPCVSEFPSLMATNRMYRERPFSFTTVSSNVPDEKPQVLAFLQKMKATTTNLLFGSDDTYAMQEAFDPDVGSAVPVTVLLSPRGDVLLHEQGEIDLMAIRRAILANLPDDADHPGSQRYWASK